MDWSPGNFEAEDHDRRSLHHVWLAGCIWGCRVSLRACLGLVSYFEPQQEPDRHAKGANLQAKKLQHTLRPTCASGVGSGIWIWGSGRFRMVLDCGMKDA